MSESMKGDLGGGTGYTYQQLARAFDRVRDPRDWRRPVRAEIPVEMEELVARAVVWFTATTPAFAATERGQLLATAPGYLQGPWGPPDRSRPSADSQVPSPPSGGPPPEEAPAGGELVGEGQAATVEPILEPDDPWGLRGPVFGR
ncbi:MAG: hypothetical protein ACKVZ0_22755 [Gemmatimonadales bacterium]